jgi:hypothetical protein
MYGPTSVSATAVALQVSKDKAVIGLRPKRTSTGGAEKQTEQGDPIQRDAMGASCPQDWHGRTPAARPMCQFSRRCDLCISAEPKDDQDNAAANGRCSGSAVMRVGRLDPTRAECSLVGGFSSPASSPGCPGVPVPADSSPGIYNYSFGQRYASIAVDGPITINAGSSTVATQELRAGCLLASTLQFRH